MKHTSNKISGFILAAFGLLTLFLSSSVIFDLFGIREKEGNYVLFVVVANFFASIIYLISVYGFLKNLRWTTFLMSFSLFILIVAFIALQFHINSDGLYEEKTVKAMMFRISFTLVFTLIAYFKIEKTKEYER